ncbi:MAG: hypothetical protein OQK73_07705 [Gammaproteobacteria bacterium]|nr:hypothetical protein [Gammaproteobacteria bacterium]
MLNQSSQDDFLLLSPAPSQKVSLKFSGFFEGNDVVWNLTLFTLHEYYLNTTQTNESNDIRQFIFIELLKSSHEVVMNIALDVPIIDKPTIIKTIMMVRNYKALHHGWHKWGPVITISQY